MNYDYLATCVIIAVTLLLVAIAINSYLRRYLKAMRRYR